MSHPGARSERSKWVTMSALTRPKSTDVPVIHLCEGASDSLKVRCEISGGLIQMTKPWASCVITRATQERSVSQAAATSAQSRHITGAPARRALF
jgi:hypothetical protein